MIWIAAFAIISTGIVAFFTWANRSTAKAHARFQVADVREALQEVVAPDAQFHDTWDLFLAWPIDDPYLESVRQRCLTIVKECSAGHTGADMNEEGENRVRAILHELHDLSRSGPSN
jgi:hypothetical protein